MIRLDFDSDDAAEANREWGCNCGPAALAAVLGKTLNDVRTAVELAGFAGKRYMSPTMMRRALAALGVEPKENDVSGPAYFQTAHWPDHGLVRVQWEGLWTREGANPKWAYRHTHWIAVFRQKPLDVAGALLAVLDPVVFDINGGLMLFEEWKETIVPAITRTIPRADGDWNTTHSWGITERLEAMT